METHILSYERVIRKFTIKQRGKLDFQNVKFCTVLIYLITIETVL